jgi:Flp pilus assembly protein TadG
MRVLLRADAGQALAELIVITPLLLLLLVGVVEYGRYTYMSVLVGNAARAGVQYGAQSHENAANSAGIVAAATADAQGIPNFSATTPTPSYFCTCADGTAVTCSTNGVDPCPLNHEVMYVTASASASLQFVSPGSLLRYVGMPATLQISSTATMRVSQ